MLWWRVLSAVLLLPGTVALLVPWLLHPRYMPVHRMGLAVLALGALLLLWCVRYFMVVGRGSLAPWAPPERLVIVGPYRFTRNPMYVAVLVMVCGWALAFPTAVLWLYAAFVAAAFQLRVLVGEEPWLARTYGEQWTRYRATVPRWIGHLPRDG